MERSTTAFAQQWISCEDNLPKKSGPYLVTVHEWTDGNYLPKTDRTTVKTNIFLAKDNGGHWATPIYFDEQAEADSHREILAWQPMPELAIINKKIKGEKTK